MAESNFRNTAEQNDLAQDDPFAELTRIMGHDPRSIAPLSKPAAADTTGDLALELENELLGDVADDEISPAGEHSSAEVISWPRTPASAAPSQSDIDSSFDAMLEDALAQDDEFAEEFASIAAGEVAGHGLPDSEFALPDEDLAALDFVLEPATEDVAFEGDEEPAFEETEELVFEEPREEVVSYEYRPEAADEGLLSVESYEQLEAADVEAETAFDYARAVVRRPDFLSEHAAEPQAAAEEEAVSGQVWDAASVRAYEAAPDPAPYVASTWPSSHAAPATGGEVEWEEAVAGGEAAGEADLGDEWLSAALDDAADIETAGEWQDAAAVDRWQDAQPQADAGQVTRSYTSFPPEVDTVEVPEGAVALTDHFDIPDVPYREEVKPAAELNEIEEILAGAFGETADGANQPDDVWAETTPNVAKAGTAEEDERDDYFAQSVLAASGAGAAAYAGQQAAYGRDGQLDLHEDDLMPAPGIQPPPASGQSRFGGSRAMVAAAVVGGVVILGGVTALALSFGEDAGGPALVLADNSPIKVKPENPGGIEIPNQDNQVYRRVSGEQANAAPEQGRLISATEEPIKLTPPADTAPPAPAAAEAETLAEEAAPLAEETEPQTAKVEERLANPAAEESEGDDGAVSLSPRRVRSFVVRSDGTMVPNDMPEPAANTQDAAAPAPQPDNSADQVDLATAATTDAPVEEQGAGTQDVAAALAAETATIPRTGPIPPSRPANIAPAQQQAAAQPAPAQQPAQQPPAQAPAATEAAPAQVAAVDPAPPAQAASASEWSVQIASQPTVEGAQQSYQTLAQRFGSMLQGKGVNIVKADIEGKGTYYRVRIPSSSKEDAIALCSQLQSAGGSCFVSK